MSDIFTTLDAMSGDEQFLFMAGVFTVLACSFVVGLLDCLCNLISDTIFYQRRAAFCLGIQNGTINSVCRYHKCPYAQKCSFHAPRRCFSLWLHDGFYKAKRFFKMGKKKAES